MYTLEEIKEMINMLDQSTVQELEIEKDEFRILIRKASAAVSYVPQTGHAQPSYTQVIAPPPVQSTPTVAPTSGSESVNLEKETNQIDPGFHQIVSPMVGTFYEAPSPGADPYVRKGDQVKGSSIVCIVEAMKLMNEIEAEVSGEIVEILVENGQLVEYGQPLFLVKQDR